MLRWNVTKRDDFENASQEEVFYRDFLVNCSMLIGLQSITETNRDEWFERIIILQAFDMTPTVWRDGEIAPFTRVEHREGLKRWTGMTVNVAPVSATKFRKNTIETFVKG